MNTSIASERYRAQEKSKYSDRTIVNTRQRSAVSGQGAASSTHRGAAIVIFPDLRLYSKRKIGHEDDATFDNVRFARIGSISLRCRADQSRPFPDEDSAWSHVKMAGQHKSRMTVDLARALTKETQNGY